MPGTYFRTFETETKKTEDIMQCIQISGEVCYNQGDKLATGNRNDI